MASGLVKTWKIKNLLDNNYPHPDDLEPKLNQKVAEFAKQYENDLLKENDSFVTRIFHKRELTFSESEAISCTSAKDVMNLPDYVHFPCKKQIVDAFKDIQDLRKILNIKAVGSRSEDFHVMAELWELLAIDRVLDNKEYYMEMDFVIDEIEYE
jgi:hypothetical protein